MIATQEVTPGKWDVQNDEYHAHHACVSHSMLEVFRTSPLTYAARFVYGTMSAPAPTESMCLGTALHALVLEPDRFDEIVIVSPAVDRRTKDGKAQWSEFQSICNGRVVISEEQNRTITKMAKSILAHPEASKLIKRAEYREQAFRWVNDGTGIWCKCKPDLLWWAGSVIGDLKTAADPTPSAWSRQAASLGYFRQNAAYRSGIESVSGRDPQFLHIVVGSAPPFETCCYYMDQEVVDHGAFQNQQSLNALRAAIDSGDWLADQNKKFKTVSLPRWVFSE